MKARIFISAVSAEFKTLRQQAMNILTSLGYEPVVQEIFGTEAGDLREMLKTKIDSCEGLIQITGDAYGYEPVEPDADFGRVSFTQFEYFYAKQQNKKVWVIHATDACQTDLPIDQLDLPAEKLNLSG